VEVSPKPSVVPQSAGLVVRRVALDSLHPDPANARLHDDRNLEAIRGSLARFGQQKPIVVDSNGVIRAGNGTYLAAKALGWETIDVVRTDLAGLEAAAFAIADNRTSDLSAFDDAALATLLKSLQLEDALDGVGFSQEEIDDLLAAVEADNATPGEDPGPEPPSAVAVARRGELWNLGPHRILCGDSTSAEDMQRLVAGEKFSLLASDPPYCVNYTGNDRPIHKGKASGKDWTSVYREIDIADLGQFLDSVFAATLPHLLEKAPLYIWHAHVQQPTVAAAFERHGLLLHQVLVWIKPCAVFGHSYFRWRHEPCAFGWKQGSKPDHGVGQLDTVWECDWEGKSRVVGNDHPCLHPDALVLTDAGFRAIQSIRPGDRVFGNDGTFCEVTAVSAHPYQSAHLYRIRAMGGNVETLASDNHPFLVWRPELRKRRIVGGQVIWVRADEMRVGDYTMTPIPTEAEVDPLPEKDEEYWFLFGLYLAQGHLQRAGHGKNLYPTFALNKKRQDLVARIHAHWSSTSEYDPSEYGGPSQGVSVMAFDAESGAEFEALGSRLAKSKRIAPLVMQLPRAKRLAVLQGWLNGDGCRVHNREYWQGKTTSPDLAAQLQLLGESVGYRTSVFRYEPPAVLGSIQGRQFRTQQPEFHLYFYERAPDDLARRPSYLEHEGHTYRLRRVKRIEPVPYTGDVWNISVDRCESFQTAVGMSHNTQKPTRLFEIPIELHTKPGQAVLEPFSGSGSQLIAAEKLSRKCRAMEITPAFVDVAIKRWQTMTGRQATLDGDGRTFDELSAERLGAEQGAQ